MRVRAIKTAADQPLELHVRVFEADDGWRWRVEAWVGNVDVRNTPPKVVQESRRAFVRRASAIRNATSVLADTSEVK